MTSTLTGTIDFGGSGFRGRTFLWAGAGLLLSLAVALAAANDDALHDLFWSTTPLVPLSVCVAEVAIVGALCVWWRTIPFGTVRLLYVTFAALLGTTLSSVAGGSRAFVTQVLAAVGCTFVGAGLICLAALLERGRLRPVLAMAATGLLAATLLDVAWAHSNACRTSPSPSPRW